jgi:hypothetical protein
MRPTMASNCTCQSKGADDNLHKLFWHADLLFL